MNAIKAGHPGSGNLPPESEDISGIGAELDATSIHPTLQLAMLPRTVEGAINNVAVLCDLNLFQRAARPVHVIGIDRPASGKVLGGWVFRAAGNRRRWRRDNAWGRRRPTLRVVLVGEIGSKLELLVSLAQQVFRPARMAAEMGVVGVLCIADTGECLNDRLLCRGKITVLLWIDSDRRNLRCRNGGADGKAGEDGEDDVVRLHGVSFRHGGPVSQNENDPTFFVEYVRHIGQESELRAPLKYASLRSSNRSLMIDVSKKTDAHQSVTLHKTNCGSTLQSVRFHIAMSQISDA